MIFKCHDCESEFDERYAVYYGHLMNPRCPVCGSSVAGIRPADLPEAGASAERISSVVRSNATTGWIKVSERLPEINIPVLAIIPDVYYPAYAFRANNADEYMVYYTSGVKRCNTVTHWMPLPGAPEV